jgi:hypothetical protein
MCLSASGRYFGPNAFGSAQLLSISTFLENALFTSLSIFLFREQRSTMEVTRTLLLASKANGRKAQKKSRHLKYDFVS